MKIAIAAEGKEETSYVSLVSGRAPYYLIFEDNKLVKTISNPFKTGGGGAGIGVVKMLEKEGVSLVISGNFGSNMIEYLNDKKMKYKLIKDKTAKEALEEI